MGTENKKAEEPAKEQEAAVNNKADENLQQSTESTGAEAPKQADGSDTEEKADSFGKAESEESVDPEVTERLNRGSALEYNTHLK